LWRWAAVTAAAMLACVSGYAALLVLLALAMSAGATWRECPLAAKRTLIVATGVAIGVGVWVMFSPPHGSPALLPRESMWALVWRIVGEFASGAPTSLLPGLILLSFSVAGITWSDRARMPRGLVAAWVGLGTGGVVVADRLAGAQFETWEIAFVLPAYLALAGVGLSRLRVAVSRWVPRPAACAAAFLLIPVLELPGLATYLRQ